MNFLKGLVLALLSFLLFISLTIFGLAFMLNQTILNPDFVAAEVNRLDISSLAKDLIRQQVPQEGDFLTEAIDDAIADLEPWIKEQANTVIYSGYNYLTGKSNNLSVVIPLEPAKQQIKETLRKAILQSPPPELQGLPQAEIERYFNDFYEDFANEIPSTFHIDETSVGTDVIGILKQARQITGYFQIGYKALIGFMLFLILCIILINRQVKATTRGLGITFLTYGAFEYAGIFLAKRFGWPQLSLLEIPSSLQTWLPQFLNNLLAPLEMLSLGIMIAGVVLIIISIAYKPREPSF